MFQMTNFPSQNTVHVTCMLPINAYMTVTHMVHACNTSLGDMHVTVMIMLNKNTLGVKKVRGQSEATMVI